MDNASAQDVVKELRDLNDTLKQLLAVLVGMAESSRHQTRE